jgi:FAD/FMN-containing dehydrogenase
MSVEPTALMTETLRPGNVGYDDAARTFFGTGRPALVVRPRGPDEIPALLRSAERLGLSISVRSGGHSPLAHGTNVDGMVIDLLYLDGIEVLDSERRLVRVGAGATWGQVASALEPYGWAITSGDTANVGVGGLTLGGGIGWMVRRHGLAVDSLVGARIVTADGRLLTTSAHRHADLFWALRGGGGNFGVVVDFDFVAQPVTSVHFGAVTYSCEPAELTTLLTAWRDAMRAAPEQLSSTVALPPRTPGSAATAVVLLCYAAEPGATLAEADSAIEPLLGLGAVTEAVIAERRYAEILEVAEPPPHLQLVARNALLGTLDDAAMAGIVDLGGGPAPTAVAVRSLGGAFGRVPADATAFAHRASEAMVVALVMLPEGAARPDVEEALAQWYAVAARGIGTYVNFQGSASPEDVAAAYPPATYARLRAVKRAYDPANRFALNHNIEPATSPTSAG